MSDPSATRNQSRGKKNFHNVEAHGRGAAGKFPQISVRSGDDASLLLPSDRILGLVSGQIVTGFYLDYDQLPLISSDQINLSPTCPIIPCENFHPGPLNIAGRHPFPVFTGPSCVRPSRARLPIPRVKTIDDGSDKVRDRPMREDVAASRSPGGCQIHMRDITGKIPKGFGPGSLLR